jgi:hypothetical protein
MSEEFEPKQKWGASYTWSEAWIAALTRPSEQTYAAIAHDPEATNQRAYNWIAIAVIVAYLIQIVAILVFAGGAQFDFVSLLCGIPVAIVVVAIVFTISAGLSHVIARMLGGVGEYAELANALAAYYAPLSIISAVLATVLLFIPVLGQIAGLILGLYAIVLNVIAIKAVHEFEWWKAIFSSIVIWLFLVACVVIVVLTLLGPAIGNVFSNIITQMNY